MDWVCVCVDSRYFCQKKTEIKISEGERAFLCGRRKGEILSHPPGVAGESGSRPPTPIITHDMNGQLNKLLIDRLVSCDENSTSSPVVST